MGQDVETAVETERPARRAGTGGLDLRLLGPLALGRDGVPVALPASRKVRALIAYLGLSQGPVSRSHLCELLWEIPNDPRGELRWCLSKLRSVLNGPDRERVETSGDTVRLDLSGCFVDVLEVDAAARAGLETLGATRLRTLARLFAGDFLEGLEIDRSPAFETWLAAQRRRLRACHASILERLVACLPQGSDEALGCLDRWLQLAPFDMRVHEALLNALALRGRIREGEEHVAATARHFDAEGIPAAALRAAWRSARSRDCGHRAAAVPTREASPQAEGAGAPTRRASVAVMPFLDRTAGGIRGGLADGLVHDVITRLARLRSVCVIARGSVFALDERGVAPEEAGRLLKVDYVASGWLRCQGERASIGIELTETATSRIVWAEVFEGLTQDSLLILDDIGDRIVASVAGEIETAERNRAILKPPDSLDAWEAYHRGLWHAYRFNRLDNELAQHFFGLAVRLDRTFARAHAGLSFTHFQSAFLDWGERDREIDRAFAAAGQSMMADDRDPAAHWAMGRALWLRGRQDQSVAELETAVELSPNFALGHYTLAFVHSQSGDPRTAIQASDLSRRLSPFDPLLFGMFGSRAMAHVRLGQFDEAADWALKAAGRPNAHVHILAIAANCLALAGRIEEAQAFGRAIRRSVPAYRIDDFLAAFRFPPEVEALFRSAPGRCGLD
ncbi:tetratricopeptide repeat protein [Arenibaculum pallidiluteum]|uniref:tetratricopeptide repeat protein n=1 Tax=Arenibaculum pallidiluteum TaxID=2812559 RepID=UPI001A97AA08|nr:tetratricopeptide repeat protein [Arenibaculum pallidiluteum]